MKRSYYQNSINRFLEDTPHNVLGNLSFNHEHKLEELQKNAWIKQIQILKQSLKLFHPGKIYFEFSIPRMGKRVDNILVIKDLIFVLEFKIGEQTYPLYAQTQTIDYCLDLLNFHESSHNKNVIPVLIATKAPVAINDFHKAQKQESCILCNDKNLTEVLSALIEELSSDQNLDIENWENGIYKPTPTIIEAAQALYKKHNVKDISRNDAGAINLSKTSQAINKIIDNSKANDKKSICFLTGVPGAGKTLAGLNIAIERRNFDSSEHSVFLSGNGPLVDVLREALTRDTFYTAKEKNEKTTRSEAERKAKSFIQNIHHFRDDNLKSEKAPIEKVVVFDEAQRAWERDQVSSFMRKKKGIEDFNMSEPEYLISVMDQHKDWCTIVCLIGGGQEINTGEAGVSEWLISLQNKFKDWEIYYSDKILDDKTYLDSQDLYQWLIKKGNKEVDLHLSVSVRSFRSEKVSLLVQSILENKDAEANEIYNSIKGSFPIYITRNLNLAKNWLKRISKGSERIGIIASSGAKRLRSEGINVKNDIFAADWFLNDPLDVRSSYYLEEIATEFDIQGLEIDYTCLAWDINMYYKNGWKFQAFKGSKWQNINNELHQKYLLNAYRVLLTRARQGMVIFVPQVDDSDWTRPKELYDSVYTYLQSIGFIDLELNSNLSPESLYNLETTF